MDEMEQPSSLDSEGTYSSMARPSSAFYYRQSEPTSITEIHQIVDENHEILIEIQPMDSGFSMMDGSISDLSTIVKERNLIMLSALGGVVGVAAALKTSLKDGISGSSHDISHRQGTFGSNVFHKDAKSFLHFVQEALQDILVLVLLVCAALSIGLGIKIDGHKEGWFDGGSIIFVVFLVISVSAMASFMKNRLLVKIFEASYSSPVTVVRDGRRRQISISEVVVGDIVLLIIGDQVPADGLFVEGHSLRTDESSMTGESALAEINPGQNPFLLSGVKVAAGYAKMLVTSVGMNTTWGERMSLINSEDFDVETPLEARVNQLAISLGKVGLAVAFTIFLMLLGRYLTGHTKYEDGRIEFIASKTEAFDVIKHVVNIVAVVASILFIGVPDGLPLGITFILSYSMKRLMMNDEAIIVRNLSAFETMSSVTVLCTDMSSILTSNQIKVTKSFLGKEWIEGRSRCAVRQFLSVTATDDAIHSWAVLKLNMEMNMNTRDFSILDIDASCPEKRVGILVKNQLDKLIHAHWNGDAEIILSSCSHYQDENGNIATLDGPEREIFNQIIEDMAANSLQSIAFAHKQIPQDEYENEENDQNIPNNDLVLLGIIGLKALHQPGVKEAIATCQQAGIKIQVITSGNVSIAKAICSECGILAPNQDGSMVKGVEFSNYTDKERLDKVKNITVMPRSSPLEKLLAVRCLKEKGDVVAVTANGPNDARALAEANVGVSMGKHATAMVKESSDIVVVDENFTSIAQVLRWGRCVFSNIQKYIQFHLTVYASALVINLVAAALVGKTQLTPAQLLWVDLITEALGPVALAAEEPTTELMKERPVNRADMLITNIMCWNIIVQALYQITALIALKLKGKTMFGIREKSSDTLIFTTFVLCQVFNLFNARILKKKNVFKGILKNKMFLLITGATIIIQLAMVEVLNKFAHAGRLDWKQWGLCIGIAAFTWPVGLFTKFLPAPDICMETIFSYLPLE
ncbi:Calcium transporting ATPase [Handroanthus impetiginosus]|uniref:Calcium-transporting ATPase n=1 Tax=Handroanthus impetiginosus TaxID=429701 RepID=A0A2G9I0N1_9LAMI|nr:Calcium transporting ATPase [Handroanthus impetiginosus]